ncbi:MAG: extracellular solute-binding protein [Clostridia bacterium]|nr:extracellular solute-binding protein [Clostridia bacterium]
MKKIIAMMMICLLTASCCAFGLAEEEFDPRQYTEGVTLTIAIPENATIIDYASNLTTLAIEEKFGVHLEFITIPKADYTTKLNVMVMGGDKLPDIIMNPGTTNADWSGWINEGALIPLSATMTI